MDTKTYRRKLPQGLSSFAKLRELKCLYVDKTEIIWNLVNCDSYINYLSRPRRFGKTMLVDTLQCYFEGRKELFEGLKINNYEKEWKQYPVIRLDMSNAGASAESLKSFFDREFQYLESKYDITIKETDSLTVRFNSIIKKAYQDTKNRVVILIDEYDCPLQHSWHTPEHEKCTAIYRDVFAVLKSADAYERFVFITGITKFTQISLFSVLNNLNNISFLPNYAEICGISKQELLDNFQPEIQLLANKFKCSYDNAVLKLKENYDGYHFSDENMTDMFNPFSLINALANQKISNYWIASGATSMIYKFVTDLDINIDKYDNYLIERDTLESSDVSCGDNGLFLYQTGYLTIKSFDDDVFILGFPNKEVRKALYKFVLPSLTMRAQNIVSSEQTQLIYNLKQANIPEH
ncbi:MAG: AAA family ATPase [Bacteroidales bacterium]|nr:AAA family ATPase [Bacteroidales bacterium]